MYEWWVFVHLVGVAGFLISHGVSIVVTFRLRAERDPRRIDELIQLSGSSIVPFYVSLGLLLLGGVVAGFLGDWWGRAWIWASIAVLVATSVTMYVLAKPYYRRVGLIARAMAGGSRAVSQEQFAATLRSTRPPAIAAVGFARLLVILYLMMFKPSLGFSTSVDVIALARPGATVGGPTGPPHRIQRSAPTA